MDNDKLLRFRQLMSRVTTAQAAKAQDKGKLTTLKDQLAVAKNNLRLRARFLSVSEKFHLNEHLTADESTIARLADEHNWQATETVVIGQHQQCACGHVADATVGIFVRQKHAHIPNAWRLRESRTIHDGLPLVRQWSSAHLPRCIKCAEVDTVDELLVRFDTLSQRQSDQLELWS